MKSKIEQVKAKVQAEISAAQAALDKANAKMAKIRSVEEALNDLAEEFGADEPPTPPVARKSTTKAKATVKKAKKKVTKKAAKAKPKKAAKAKPKKAAKAKPKKADVQTVTAASKKNAAAGRAAVARGERPPLKKAIITVLGKRTMNAAMIVKALEAKKWLPSSSDPRQYVSYMLSSNTPDTFERTAKRGFYRVRAAKAAKAAKAAPAAKAPTNSNGKKKPAKKKAKTTKKASKKASKKAAETKANPQTDAKLNSMFDIDTSGGTDVASDPHAEAGAS